MARRRDPDAMPPSNNFEAVMNYLYKGTLALRGGNTLFALKAAALTGQSRNLDSRNLLTAKNIYSDSMHTFLPQIIWRICIS